MDWIRHLLQTSDSLFPTGAYAHSLGLEGLVQDEWVSDLESLRDYLERSVRPSLTHVDLPLIRFARAASIADAVRLGRLCHALRPSRELREASVRMGRQRLELVARLTANEALGGLAGADGFQPHLPVVFGFECGALEIPLHAALVAYLYQSYSAQVSAALKLLRLGQTAAQTLLARLMASSEESINRSLALDEDHVGWFAPAADIASARHETAYTRLFIS